MDLDTFHRLLTPEGQRVLQAAQDRRPQEVDFLRHFSALSRQFPRELSRAALEIAILRQEARVKFPQAASMYFTRPAVEQATAWAVSSYRALRFQAYDMVFDLGCSIGGDTLALAQLTTTVGVDRDPLRLSMARQNLHRLGGEAFFVRADLQASLPWRKAAAIRTALFFDPARRSAARRSFSVNEYHPPLTVIQKWLPAYPALGVKISPGVNLNEIREYDAEVEFISERGELKEATLWFGPLRRARRQATVLPGPHCMSADFPDSERDSPPPVSQPRTYLYEPDPAVLRAGLVQHLGAALNAVQLDPDIAYLTADSLTQTPFARAWEVEAWFPFQLKRLRAALRERQVGRLTIKKRGSPFQPEALKRALRLKGDAPNERVLFLTHLDGAPIVILCFP